MVCGKGLGKGLKEVMQMSKGKWGIIRARNRRAKKKSGKTSIPKNIGIRLPNRHEMSLLLYEVGMRYMRGDGCFILQFDFPIGRRVIRRNYGGIECIFNFEKVFLPKKGRRKVWVKMRRWYKKDGRYIVEFNVVKIEDKKRKIENEIIREVKNGKKLVFENGRWVVR